MVNDRAVIPSTLRQSVLTTLHAAHQGVTGMASRARAIVFWPMMIDDIERVRANCRECNQNAPSQAHVPSIPADPPGTPFEQIYADFFEFGGRHYLIIGDRLSGWSDIYASPTGTAYAGARGLVRCLRAFFGAYGVPEQISSDGGPEFTSDTLRQFLKRWGVRHRISSAYFPRSNGRAEVAVKSAKRLLRTNVGPGGSLNNDRFLEAILQLRNTPDPDCKVSPAQILFGRPIRDNLMFTRKLHKFSNPLVVRTWQEAWRLKEMALRTRYAKSAERLNRSSRDLPPMRPGDACFIQNQWGKHPLKWERSGIIMEALPHNQYTVKVDGSGRLTIRNRKFIRRFSPETTLIERSPLSSTVVTPNIEPTPTSSSQRIPAAPDTSTECRQGTAPNTTNPAQNVPATPPVHAPSLISNGQDPAALRRLRPFNNPGLTEDGAFPLQRLRSR